MTTPLRLPDPLELLEQARRKLSGEPDPRELLSQARRQISPPTAAPIVARPPDSYVPPPTPPVAPSPYGYREAAVPDKPAVPSPTRDDFALGLQERIAQGGRLATVVPPMALDRPQAMPFTPPAPPAEIRASPLSEKELAWQRYEQPLAEKTAAELSDPSVMVRRALGRDVGARFIGGTATKLMDLVGKPLGLEAHPAIRNVVETAQRQRELEQMGEPAALAEFGRGLTEFVAEIGLLPGAARASTLGPSVGFRKVAAGPLAGRIAETGGWVKPGTTTFGRVARRAMEDAARFGYVETAVSPGQEDDPNVMAARQLGGVLGGLVLGGGFQTLGELWAVFKLRVGNKAAARTWREVWRREPPHTSAEAAQPIERLLPSGAGLEPGRPVPARRGPQPPEPAPEPRIGGVAPKEPLPPVVSPTEQAGGIPLGPEPPVAVPPVLTPEEAYIQKLDTFSNEQLLQQATQQQEWIRQVMAEQAGEPAAREGEQRGDLEAAERVYGAMDALFLERGMGQLPDIESLAPESEGPLPVEEGFEPAPEGESPELLAQKVRDWEKKKDISDEERQKKIDALLEDKTPDERIEVMRIVRFGVETPEQQQERIRKTVGGFLGIEPGGDIEVEPPDVQSRPQKTQEETEAQIAGERQAELEAYKEDEPEIPEPSELIAEIRGERPTMDELAEKAKPKLTTWEEQHPAWTADERVAGELLDFDTDEAGYLQRINTALDEGRVENARALWDEGRTKDADGYYEIDHQPQVLARIEAAEAEAKRQGDMFPETVEEPAPPVEPEAEAAPPPAASEEIPQRVKEAVDEYLELDARPVESAEETDLKIEALERSLSRDDYNLYVEERARRVGEIRDEKAQQQMAEVEAETPTPPMLQEAPAQGFKYEVKVEGKWSSNAQVFPDKAAAEAAAKDLMSRWMLPTDFQVVPVDEAPTEVPAPAEPEPAPPGTGPLPPTGTAPTAEPDVVVKSLVDREVTFLTKAEGLSEASINRHRNKANKTVKEAEEAGRITAEEAAAYRERIAQAGVVEEPTEVTLPEPGPELMQLRAEAKTWWNKLEAGERESAIAALPEGMLPPLWDKGDHRLTEWVKLTPAERIAAVEAYQRQAVTEEVPSDATVQRPVAVEPGREPTGRVRGTPPEPAVEELGEGAEGERGVTTPEPGEVGAEETTPTAERPGRGAVPGRARHESEGSGPPRTRDPGTTERDAGTDAGGATGNDYRITDEVASWLSQGGEATRVQANLKAIELVKKLELEGRKATGQEQNELVKYTGWGQAKSVFDNWGKWREANRQLRELLTEEEYDAAAKSVLNAHYTSPEVVDAIWKAVTRLGFRGGYALEPAMGTGMFLGRMPRALSHNTKWSGVELDKITGAIAQHLYPSADIQITGFQNAALAPFHNLVTSNVPFGDLKILSDATYSKHKWPIHNYFFAKALDYARENGLIAFVTSSWTMDSAKATPFRQYMDERAEFLGAIRLPNTAFKGVASTEVTTDIIFLRKRAKGEIPQQRYGDWIEVAKKKVPAPDDQTADINVNQYYHDHPEMMLGNMEATGTMYRRDAPTLQPIEGASLAQQLGKAIRRLPENVAGVEAETQKPQEMLRAEQTEKEGAFVLREKKLYVNEGGKLTPAKLGSLEKDRVSRLMGIRDAAKGLIRLQLEGAERAEKQKLRKQLNTLYDRFVKKHGPINMERRTVTPKGGVKVAKPNLNKFSADPESVFVETLENYDSDTGKATKTDIFLKDVARAPKEITETDSATDAMFVTLDRYGTLDIDRVAELAGKPREEVISELAGQIFMDPEQDKFVMADEYLSGDVRRKLTMAQSAARMDPQYQGNVTALEAVQPEDIPVELIDPQFGAPWIPPAVIRDFAEEILKTGRYQHSRVKVEFVPKMGLWSVTYPHGVNKSAAATAKWGTKRYPATQLIDDALNQQQPIVRDTDEDGKPYVNREQTELAQQKLQDLREEFTRWMWADDKRAVDMHRLYNDAMNNLVDRVFDGSHLTFPGMTPQYATMLRDYQRAAVHRILSRGNTGLFHAVGAGKTWTMVAAGMEARRLGFAQKALYVVPNQMVRQFAKDAVTLYPQANLLIPTKDDLTAKGRQKFLARIATGDWDGIVIPHSQMKMLPMSGEFQAEFIRKELRDYEALTAGIDMAQLDRRTRRQIENAKAKLHERLTAALDRAGKEQGVTFEELGVDMLFVDEAHAFKKPHIPTRLQAFMQQPSDRAVDLTLKTRYINSLKPGRNVVFATGTPVTNTLAEVWVMQHYLNPEGLSQRGMEFIDSWVASFAQAVTKTELHISVGRGYVPKTRFAKFVNVAELIHQFREFADVKMDSDIELERPDLKGGQHTVVPIEPSDEQVAFIQELGERAEAVKGQPPTKGGDNVLAIGVDGRKAAVDMRLIDAGSSHVSPAFRGSHERDPNGKIATAARQMHEIWAKTAERKSTQLVLLDIGAPSDKGEQMYGALKEELLELGVPADEIRYVHEAKTDAAKEVLYAEVRQGKVRFLFGTREKAGVGLNIQKRLIAIHNLDAPWTPAMLEQGDGRGLRPGNENKEIEIFRYVTEGSFDVFMWQTLERKAMFSKQAMSGDYNIRALEEIDDYVDNYTMAKAAATGDPRHMDLANFEMELGRLHRLKRGYDSQQWTVRQEIAMKKEGLAYNEQRIETLEPVVEQLQPFMEEKGFKVTIGDTEYTKRKDAGEALLTEMQKMKEAGERQAQRMKDNRSKIGKKIGQFGGEDLWVQADTKTLMERQRSEAVKELRGEIGLSIQVGLQLGGSIGHNQRPEDTAGGVQSWMSDEPTAKGAIQTLDYLPKRFVKQLEDSREITEKLTGEVKELEVEREKPFKQQERFDELTEKYNRLAIELGVMQAPGSETFEADLAEIMSLQGGEARQRWFDQYKEKYGPIAWEHMSNTIDEKIAEQSRQEDVQSKRRSNPEVYEQSDIGAAGPATTQSHGPEPKSLDKVRYDTVDDPRSDVTIPSVSYGPSLFELAREIDTEIRYKHLVKEHGNTKTKLATAKVQVDDITDIPSVTHELGHAIDYRLNDDAYPPSIIKRLGDHVTEGMTEAMLRKELGEASQAMRPIDGGPKKFSAYRRRHTELMADYIGLYLLDPEMAATLAPNVTEAFEAKLWDKPKLHEAMRKALEGRITEQTDFRVPEIRPIDEPQTLIADIEGDFTEEVKALVKSTPRMFRYRKDKAALTAKKWRESLTEMEREDIGAAVEGIGNLRTGKSAEDVLAGLSPKQKATLKQFRYLQEEARQSLNKFMLDVRGPDYISYLEDYLLHFYAGGKKKVRPFAQRWARKIPSAKKRKLPTLEDAVNAGLTPLTQDIAELHQLWAEMNWRGAVNQRFVYELKNIVNDEGMPVIMKPNEAPPDWPIVDHPAIQQVYARPTEGGATILWKGGAAVDPEVYQLTRQVFEQPFRGNFARTVETINAFAKTAALSLSLFHHWALTESSQAALARSWNPIRGLVMVGKHRTGIPLGGKLKLTLPHLEGLELMESTDFRRDLQMQGVNVDAIPDVMVGRVIRALREAEARVRKTPVLGKVPGVSTIASGPRRFLQLWNHLLWTRYYTGLKSYAYYDLVKEQMKRMPDGATPADIKRVKEKVAELVNDMFGGQEWEGKFWLTPKGRQVAHMLLLAPDWTLSNINVASKTFTQAKDPVTRKVLWRYWFNMIASFMGMVATANRFCGGRWPWDNEPGHKLDIDVTCIMKQLPWTSDQDKESGRRWYVKPGKQFREVLRYLTNPVSIITAKASPLVQMAFEQATGHQGGQVGWEMPWAREEMNFYESLSPRAVSIMEKFEPFAIRGNNFAFTFPMSRGMSWYKAQKAYERIIQAQVDPAWYKQFMPGADADAKKAEIDAAAELNGLDATELYKEANTMVRSRYYGLMWKALQDDDQKEADRIAGILLPLGVTRESLQQSGQRRGVSEELLEAAPELPPAGRQKRQPRKPRKPR